MIDIDFFKKYNDTYGHQAGDTCLERLGECFSNFGKKHNLTFFRYGGEEFTALSAGDTYEKLGTLSEKLLADVSRLYIPFPVTKRGFITISIGYAHKNSCRSGSYDELIQMSDEALYISKTRGRSCAYGYDDIK